MFEQMRNASIFIRFCILNPPSPSVYTAFAAARRPRSVTEKLSISTGYYYPALSSY